MRSVLDAAVINQAAVFTIILSGIALVVGVALIRQGNRPAHMKAMITACGFATIFLVLYLTRLALGYEKAYAGPDAWKPAYLVLLISHIILAAANLPLALGALWHAKTGYELAGGDLARVEEVDGARAAFARHRAWVRWTVPVWLYVAVTGWVIYVILGRYGEVMHEQAGAWLHLFGA